MNDTRKTTPMIGRSVPRKEDRRFLTGRAVYGDDLDRPDLARALVLRSPHAHARIEAIHTAAARQIPGVLLLLTGTDLVDEVAPLPSYTRTPPFDVPNEDGSPVLEANQPVLAVERVRYLGEPVALVVAESEEAAREALEAIEVDYAPLPPLMSAAAATAPGAPAVHDDVPGNVAFRWQDGDAEGTEQALAAAHRVVQVRLRNNRIAPVFMEPRSALAEIAPDTGALILHTGAQSAHRMHDMLCACLGLEPAELTVLVPEMGGGFGARTPVYPENALVLVAARRLSRPVKWTASRSESFLTDTQSRDHWLIGELGVDRNGRFTALRVQVQAQMGGYLTARSIWLLPATFVPTLGGVYRIPVGHTRISAVYTNTTPIAAIRGVGRVETNYLMESLVEAAARRLRQDPLTLRRLNMLRDDELPFTSVGGARYVSCRFLPHLEQATAMARWQGFAARRRESKARGQLRGIGACAYVENDGGAPSEYARVEVAASGQVTLYSGTQNFGMGHETVLAQILADRLGVTLEAIELVQGDTARVPRGFGSMGSRSIRVGGTAIVMSAERVIELGREEAAELLEVATADVDFDAGEYRVTGTDRVAGLADVAAHAHTQGRRLEADADFEQTRESYSSGCHVCEVEIDPETGVTTLLSHVLVTDVGTAMNPMLLDGQIHGGAVQGLGQAALEQVVYDPDSGQTLTGSLMDYVLPRADDVPAFITATAHTPEDDNPLEAKGVGEGPTSGAPAAYMNAVRDALAGAGRRAAADRLQMPASPLQVWQLLHHDDNEAPPA